MEGWAVDFLLCSLGLSALVVAGAWAVRLIRMPETHSQPSRGPEGGGLDGRLARFQETRFAPPPIVQPQQPAASPPRLPESLPIFLKRRKPAPNKG